MIEAGYEYTPITYKIEKLSNQKAVSRRTERRKSKNEAYITGLGKLEKAGYYTALLGIDDPFSQIQPINFDVEGQGGCVGKAERANQGILEIRTRYRSEIKQARAQAKDGEIMADANQKWSQCMAKKGYEYSRPSDIARAKDEARLRQISENGGLEDFKFDRTEFKGVSSRSKDCKEKINYKNKKKRAIKKAVNSVLKDKKKRNSALQTSSGVIND